MNKREALHAILDSMLDELEAHEENTDMLDLTLSDTVMVDEDIDAIRIVTLSAEIIEMVNGEASIEEYELHTELYLGQELENEMRLPLDFEE